MAHRFLQIHTLTPYPASLLNRDDAGFAKRMPFGGAVRTRVSSQCLKRHWRTADDENALHKIQYLGDDIPMAVRSRRTFDQHLFDPMIEDHDIAPEVAEAIGHGILEELLGESKKAQAAKKKAQEEDEKIEVDMETKQVTVFGRPEINYLLGLALDVAREVESQDDPSKQAKEAKKAIKSRLKDRDLRKNLERVGAGLDAALFGRMTTGDILSRTDAAIHVAHAFTTHEGEFETDYFSALDDLMEGHETGSGHINTAELSSGLFYCYVVVDVPLLISNITGCVRRDWREAEPDGRALAAEVVRRLIHLIATVSPGAKLGATAPYSRAHLVLAEAGNAQPRTLANAFLDAVDKRGVLERTYRALGRHVRDLDRMYGADTERRLAAVGPVDALGQVAGHDQLSLAEVATWAAQRVEGATS
ncbi:MAG: type I-E CRISPR-associated protein Cas7/Cse4/CasC [Acidobacteriota bacterium]